MVYMKLLYFFAICFCVQFAFANVQTLQVSSASPFLTLEFWDYEDEDCDWVRIVVDGNPYREFELKNSHKSVIIPILFSEKKEIFVNVIGIKSGSGPVTYAVQATGIGSSLSVYKNYADVGAGNSYRIVKTSDDFFSKIANFTGLLSVDDLAKRTNVAEYFNEILDEKMRDKLPNGNKLPRITPDMIVIDPSKLQGNEEMKYDADNNLFIVKDDIPFSWWEWDSLVDWTADLPFVNDRDVTEVKYREKNMLHELGHFYQDKMAEMFPNDFLPPTIDDIVRAEGFAVLESARLSEDWLTLAEHDLPDAKIDNEVSYLEATARYVESLPTENDNEINREWFKRTAEKIRSIEDTENKEEKEELSKAVYNILQDLPTNRLVDGIRCKKDVVNGSDLILSR